MTDYSGIRMQKVLAMGGGLPEGDFGVEKLASRSVNGPDYSHKNLKDDERGARSPINGNQANPDHGWD